MEIKRVNIFDAHKKILSCIRSCESTGQISSIKDWVCKIAKQINKRDKECVLVYQAGHGLRGASPLAQDIEDKLREREKELQEREMIEELDKSQMHSGRIC